MTTVREQLAEALIGHVVLYGVDHRARCIGCGWIGTDESGQHNRHLADVLAPVVERIAATHAADELENAAAHLDRMSPVAMEFLAAERFRARAAAIRTEPTNEETHRG